MPVASKDCFCCGGACCTKTPGGTLPQAVPPLSIAINAPVSTWTPFWSQIYKPSGSWFLNNWLGSTIQVINNTPCDCRPYFRFVVTDACKNTEDPRCSQGTVRLIKELNPYPYTTLISCMGQNKVMSFGNIETGNYYNCCAVKAEMQYRAFMPCGGPANPPKCNPADILTLKQETVQVTHQPPQPPGPPYIYADWLGTFTIVAQPTCSKNQVWLAEFRVELTFPPWAVNPPSAVCAVAQCLSVTAIPSNCAFDGLPYEANAMNLCYPDYQSCSCSAPPPPAYGPFTPWNLKPGAFVTGEYVSRATGGRVSKVQYRFATLGGEGGQYEECCCNQYVSTWRYGWCT